MSDDISFCPYQCARKKCMRNMTNIKDKTIPHSFYVYLPDDCPGRIKPRNDGGRTGKDDDNGPNLDYGIRFYEEGIR